MQLRATIILAAVILLCSPIPSLSAESSALQEVKIGHTSTSISAFLIEFARRKGFFREEGPQRFDDHYENERHHECPAYPRDRLRHADDLRDQRSCQRLAGESGGGIDGTSRLLSRCSSQPYSTAVTQSSQRGVFLNQELFTLRPQRLRGEFYSGSIQSD